MSNASPKLRCWLISGCIGLSPVISWPFTYTFRLLGCAGNEGVGIHCPRFLGIDFSFIPDLLFLFGAWGGIFSFPLGIILFLLCGFAPWKRQKE